MKRSNAVTRGLAAVVLSAVCMVALAACSSVNDSAKALQANDITVIYLVRHAEKEEGDSDPDLTSAGRDRAMTLARVLDTQTVHKLWSSDYARTRQTVLPLSEQRQIPVTLYDAHDSNALVESIMQSPAGQTHVIAGHSNTVPELVDLLEAWPKTPLTKRSNLGHDEYDRLYVVTVVPDQPHRVEERRY